MVLFQIFAQRRTALRFLEAKRRFFTSRYGVLQQAQVSLPRDWVELATKELGGKDPAVELTKEVDGLTVKPVYTKADLDNLKR